MEAKFNMAVADGRAISEALRSAVEADDATFYLGANTCDCRSTRLTMPKHVRLRG
jgi:hypothetical protein